MSNATTQPDRAFSLLTASLRWLIYVALLAALIAGVLTLTGRAPWSEVRTLESFKIGYSTKKGEDVLVLRTEVNDRVRIPGGSCNPPCSWGDVGSTLGYHNQPMPYALRIAWRDEGTGVIYRAETDLPEDLTARAARLPPVVWERMGWEDSARYLIIGVEADGGLTVWLSNAPRGRNASGRVLEKVAQAQGEEIAEQDVHP